MPDDPSLRHRLALAQLRLGRPRGISSDLRRDRRTVRPLRGPAHRRGGPGLPDRPRARGRPLRPEATGRIRREPRAQARLVALRARPRPLPHRRLRRAIESLSESKPARCRLAAPPIELAGARDGASPARARLARRRWLAEGQGRPGRPAPGRPAASPEHVARPGGIPAPAPRGRGADRGPVDRPRRPAPGGPPRRGPGRGRRPSRPGWPMPPTTRRFTPPWPGSSPRRSPPTRARRAPRGPESPRTPPAPPPWPPPAGARTPGRPDDPARTTLRGQALGLAQGRARGLRERAGIRPGRPTVRDREGAGTGGGTPTWPRSATPKSSPISPSPSERAGGVPLGGVSTPSRKRPGGSTLSRPTRPESPTGGRSSAICRTNSSPDRPRPFRPTEDGWDRPDPSGGRPIFPDRPDYWPIGAGLSL